MDEKRSVSQTLLYTFNTPGNAESVGELTVDSKFDLTQWLSHSLFVQIRERERERERQRQTDRDRERQRETETETERQRERVRNCKLNN